MGIWDGKAWGTDLSAYQDLAAFRPGAIDFGAARINDDYGNPVEDPQFANHIQRFWDGYAVPTAYWNVNSSWYPNHQMSIDNMKNQSNDRHPILNRIYNSLKNKAIGILWFSLEIAGAGSVWNAAYMEDLRNRIVPLQRAGQFPNFLIGMYSRKTIVTGQLDVVTWLNNHPEILSWAASYRTDFPGLTATSLEQVKEQRQPSALANHVPAWFDGVPRTNKRFWQYHGTGGGCQPITCPEISGKGKPSGLDLDIFEGTRKELFEMVGMPDRLGQIDPPPVVVPPSTDYEARIKALEDWKAAIKATF